MQKDCKFNILLPSFFEYKSIHPNNFLPWVFQHSWILWYFSKLQINRYVLPINRFLVKKFQFADNWIYYDGTIFRRLIFVLLSFRLLLHTGISILYLIISFSLNFKGLLFFFAFKNYFDFKLQAGNFSVCTFDGHVDWKFFRIDSIFFES